MTDARMLGPMPEDEATLAFLRMVLPEEGLGHYVVAVKASKGMQHVFVDTFDALAHTLFDIDRSGHECYFALATYRENTSRTAANATALKSLRLDVDVGKEDGYSSTQDAALAVAKFCHATGLPRPLLVESGSGGLHVYWPFNCSLPPEQWKPYAEGLKRLCAREGLKADSVCTADVARILRAPGTHNRKQRNAPKKVVVNFLDLVTPYPIETFQKLLEIRGSADVVSIRPTAFPLGDMPTFMRESVLPALAPAAAPNNYAPAYGSIVATKCAQLAAMRDSAGVMPEPEWKACLGVLAFCTDGDELAHAWSKGDERYDPGETQRKLDASKATGGPITCAHFKGLNSRCNGCPQSVVTPKQLGESLFDPRTPTPPEFVQNPFVRWENNEGGGKKQKSLTNAAMSLRTFDVICRYDVFHDRATVIHPDLAKYGQKFCDAHTRQLRAMMVTQHGHDPGRETCHEAIRTQCEANQYDPIVEYLGSLRWDNVSRLDHWLCAYLGADDSPLHRAFGRKVLLAAARRARRPGAKFDHMLVIEGLQGTGKTSAVQILAGEGNFSEQKILHLDTKAQAEQIAGKWLYEISELVGLRGRSVEDIKQFISRLSDEARPAYGREAVERSRRCVFIGTTNDTHYLQDDTGNRRFWPVKTGKIDLEGLTRDRDQLWAEAAHYEAKGESLFLPRNLWAAADAAQRARLSEDGWEDFLAQVKGKLFKGADYDEYRVSSTEVVSLHLKIPTDRMSTTLGRRVAIVMRRLGWERKVYRDEEEGPVNGYVRRFPRT